MSRAGVSFEEAKADLLKDEKLKSEYERLRPRYEAIEQIVRARKEQYFQTGERQL